MKGCLCLMLVLTASFFCQSIAFADDVERELITKRFHARWTALVEGDMASAYDYESPAYRDKISLSIYKVGFSEDIVWKTVELDGIKFENKKHAVIKFRLDSVFKLPWGGKFVNTSSPTEIWLYEDNDWWHLREAAQLSKVEPK